MRKILFCGIGMMLLSWLLWLATAVYGSFSGLRVAASLTAGTVSPLSDSICPAGDPGVFTSQPPTGGAGPVTYQWQVQPGCSGPWTDIPGANSLSYDPPGGLTASACFRISLTDTVCTVFSDSVSVVVLPGPAAGINPVGSNAVCAYDSVLFVATGGGTYTWLFNNQVVPVTGDSFTAYVQGDVAVVVSNAFGCTDTSLTYAVTWFPIIQVNVTASDSMVCPGDTVALSSTSPGQVASFQWTQDGTPIPGATSASFAATDPGQYQLVVTDVNGCQSSNSPFEISPGNPPVSLVDSIASNLVCAGQPLAFTGHGSGGYQWLLNGQPIPGATDSIHQADATGAYSLVTSNGCGSDTSTALAIIALRGPTAAFDYENYPHHEVLFINESMDETEWLWVLDGIASAEENIYHGFPGPGSYPVTLVVRDSLGCQDSLTLQVDVMDPEFFVPNVFTPNGDEINDQARTRFNHLSAIDFSIFDRWGNKIFISNSADVYWDGKVGGKPAPEGVYFYQFKALDIRGKVISQSGNITLLR